MMVGGADDRDMRGGEVCISDDNIDGWKVSPANYWTSAAITTV